VPQLFINRPILAWVLAIQITIGGLSAALNLPIESYPTITPPQVVVSAFYPGADAETVERSVTQIIEQQLTGIDGLLYFSSTSSSDGAASVTLTFEGGTDPDIAQVQTQNRAALAEPRLPTEVIQQGITVAKSNAGFLMAVALRSKDGRLGSGELNNLVAARVLDQVQRIPGVGAANQFGSEYAMRIWLNPDRLNAYGISAASVLNAIRSQNVQIAAGAIGMQPAPKGQQFWATVSAEGRFTSPSQFENMILRADPNGSTVRVKDVARVELGQSQYGSEARVDQSPIGGFGVQLLPGANALDVARAVKAKMAELAPSFPAGVEWFVPFDATDFIVISIEEVLITLGAAVVLVFIVMLVFLQSFRATIIPTLVVPVALLGAFIGMYVLGFSINQLTLFGMVLAIGIVVDDAIVVIESAERIMREEHLSPREATRKAMEQITGAIVTITIVLAGVFIPSALQTGSVGAIYRQFAIVIAVSMVFSAFLALSFTPALCATLLRPTHLKENVVFKWFNRAFDRTQQAYLRRVYQSVAHAPRWMGAFVVLVLVGGFMFYKLPSSFIPDEDQGYALAIVQLPAGATLERTMDVMGQLNETLKQHEAVEAIFQVGGFSFIGQGENVGLAFIQLKPWDEREAEVQDFINWANGQLFMTMSDAQAFIVNLPTIPGLGAFGGFEFYLEDRSGQGYQALKDAEQKLLQAAMQKPDVLTQVRSGSLPDAPRLKLSVDRVQAQSMGLSIGDIYSTIQLMLAPVYVNDFFYEGRILRVYAQADAPFRTSPESLNRFYVPGSLASDTRVASAGTNGTDGDFVSSRMVEQRNIPLASVVKSQWTMAPPGVTRYNGFPAIQFTGSAAPGVSSGQAMDEMERIVQEQLPAGFGFDWAGQSLQEILSGAQAPLLFLLSILVVYLCLSALYESWATPVAVMLIVPLGVLGAVLAVTLRDLPNDVFFKIGLITIIGLSAKNAILIVEFAVMAQQSGKSLHDAVLEGARLRLRPILMTSFAFILGVFPLVISTGAGANARHAIGTGVVGGMLSATLLGVLLVPVFYVTVRRLLGDPLDQPTPPRVGHATPA
jgi:multidrug efflux pump